MSSVRGLTLGALYREMRAGLGDDGRARVIVEFQQRTVAALGEKAAAEPESLVLETLAEYEDRVLDRAQVALSGFGPDRRFLVARHGDGYAYSLDAGVSWGRIAAHPRIFNVEELERELAEIEVEDATFDVLGGELSAEQPPGPETGPDPGSPATGQFVDALDVTLERSAFLRLLRVFSADADDGPEAPSLNAYSVSLEAAQDVSLLYWWSLSDGTSVAPDLPLKVHCSVSIQVSAAGEAQPVMVTLDPTLPEVADLDGVWAILRHATPGAAADADRPPAAAGPWGAGAPRDDEVG